MKNPDSIETMGAILKEESLQTVDHNIFQNTLVLESQAPFPGYHGDNMPFDTKPDSIYLVTTKHYLAENIFRIAQCMCNYHNLNFDSCPADIFIYNTHFPCIRIRGLGDYSNIAEIQGCFIDQGIAFMKKRKINASGLIRIDKVFSFLRMDDHIFKDLDDELTFYTEIPYHITWNMFRKVTETVKNNLDNSNFDAALGFVLLKQVIDFVRVYAQNPDLKRLQGIRNRYIEEIRKIQES
jgi:hypothetical protein